MRALLEMFSSAETRSGYQSKGREAGGDAALCFVVISHECQWKRTSGCVGTSAESRILFL